MATHYFGTLENTLAAGFRRSIRRGQVAPTLMREHDLEALFGAFLLRFFSKEEGHMFFLSAEVNKDTFEITCSSFVVMDQEVLVVMNEEDDVKTQVSGAQLQEKINAALQIVRKELLK